MTGYVYILQCNDGSYYTGSTKNIEARLWQHEQGMGANHTKKRLPVKLVYVEIFERIDDAFVREKQIQGWSRKKKEALMQGDFNKLHKLASCQNDSHCVGFDFAQPPSRDFAQPPSRDFAQPPSRDFAQPPSRDFAQPPFRSLSEVEGKEEIKKNPHYRSLSEVEGKGDDQ